MSLDILLPSECTVMAAFFLLHNSGSVINQPKLFSSLLLDTLTRSFNGWKRTFKRHSRALHKLFLRFSLVPHHFYVIHNVIGEIYGSKRLDIQGIYEQLLFKFTCLCVCKIDEWTLGAVLSVQLPPAHSSANKTLPVSIEEPDQRIRWSRWKNQIILSHYLRNA